jgi:HlyD family secretion protein
MLNLIKQIYSVLTHKQRKQFVYLQLLMAAMAFAEVGSVSAMGFFMAMVADQSLILKSELVNSIYSYLALQNFNQFIVYVGIATFLFLIFAATLSIITVWRVAMFSSSIGHQMADSLFKYYLSQPWLFHAAGSSSQLTKQISAETSRVTSQIVNPLMQMNAKLTLVIVMLVGLILLNPMVVFVGGGTLLLAYLLLYKLVRLRLLNNGKKISEMSSKRYKLMAESFGGIKEVLLLARQPYFIQQFGKSGKALSRSIGVNNGLVQVPKYFMEVVAFSSVIILVLYLVTSTQQNLVAILPVLTIYAVAGFKVLPAFQQIYNSIATIKGALPSFEAIKKDLINSQHMLTQKAVIAVESTNELSFKSALSMQHVTFGYADKSALALYDISLNIPANKTIAFVGHTGSGKSTLIDLILGLITPASGQIFIDNIPLTTANLRNWQKKIGFVPQSIFLSDASIMQNIAFGLAEELIDQNRIQEVLALANLASFINELPNGMHTRVGERGVQLSGGQRQRIGIARALYLNPEVLIFDEATSALDNMTERLIMDAINALAGNKTIIFIAHRLTTIQKCDVIYLMDKSRIVAQGNYETLREKSTLFREMSNTL